MNQYIEQLLQKAIDLLAKEFGEHHRGNIEVFVKKLYSHLPTEDFSKLKIDEVGEGLIALFGLFLNRPKGQMRQNIYFWHPTGHSAKSERIVIDVINDDRSFLVDSLQGLLARHGLRARILMHPVFEVKRNENGDLIELSPINGSKANSTNVESVIHCEVVDSATSDLVDVLRDKITEVYKDVKSANEDWQPMRQKIEEAIVGLRESEDILEGETLKEVLEFLTWIKDDHFTFLGYCNFDLTTTDGRLLRDPLSSNGLGVLADASIHTLSKIYDGIKFNSVARRYIHDPVPIAINKTSKISNVHRAVPMDSIWIKRFNKRGQVVGIHVFTGLFTSVAYDSSARDIPLLKKKIYEILDYCNLSAYWHDGKSLIHILDSLPRDELFQASVTELSRIGLAVLKLQQHHRVALFVRRDQFNRFLSCLVYVPRDKFDTDLCDKISDILSREFKGTVSAYKAQFGALDFARVHYTVQVTDVDFDILHYDEIEKKLIDIARSWRDELRISLADTFSESLSSKLYRKYKESFSKGYQEKFSGLLAVDDIQEIESLLEHKGRRARLSLDQGVEKNRVNLRIYNYKEPVALSEVLPSLENMDLRIITENPYLVKIDEGDNNVWIHDFVAEVSPGVSIDLEAVGSKFLETLTECWSGSIENDGFNRLVLRAGLSSRYCSLLRAYCKYIRQLPLPFGKDYIESALISNPKLAKNFIDLFESRFNPDRQQSDQVLVQKIEQDLDEILSVDVDRILRVYFHLILATLRTNFYQTDPDNQPKPYISFKFECSKIDELPLPKPMYEIFVYSPRMEAVHLRGGKVARGGIRWSDRLEDFRTEVLGLMKAQMVKNTVIVPVGSKGGFIVKKDLKSMTREQFLQEGIECYQTMIRGMLDITDNLNGLNMVPPQRVVRWDGDDPYLVVAADKGTATFSDHANAVSKEYGFWLDDAFASGGSVGYDHKKMGITARGAWESVKRHFREMDIDVSVSPITVIGIGDMSGDVFGNGMLSTKTIKLMFAFDHRHIFIDPNPDPLKSYEERLRLFKLPRSSWMDYDQNTISEGGGVYDRNAKEILLSNTVRSLLKISKEKVSPAFLLQAILKFNADLLWLGGIGTFVKSSKESHADAGDRTNDPIRVNARELQVKVLAEGANLGVTQLGRIEFASKGGRINTDAIDNSAGVDCSDHEVNIKILLNAIVQNSDLSLENRNTLLEDMTDDVAYLVLRDNYLQTLALSIMQDRRVRDLDQHVKIMHELEKIGLLNRTIEFLPDDATLQDFQTDQEGLTRPELAVLMAYVKINLYEAFLATSLPDEAFFEFLLVNYFPKQLQKKYHDAIINHPLRREIIATVSINEIINRVGFSFVYEVQEKSGCSFEDVIKICYVVINVFDLRAFWEELESLDYKVATASQISIFQDINRIIVRTMVWLLRYYPKVSSIHETSDALRAGVEDFLSSLAGCLDDEGYLDLAQNVAAYQELGLDQDLAQRLSILKIAASSPDIILISSKTGDTVSEVAGLYFKTGNRFGFNLLKQALEISSSSSFWNRWAAANLQEDLARYQNKMVVEILKMKETLELNDESTMEDAWNAWLLARNRSVSRIDQVLMEAKLHGLSDYTMISVVAREIREAVNEQD